MSPDDRNTNEYELSFLTSATSAPEVAGVLGKLEAHGADTEVMRLIANSRACFRSFVHMADSLVNRSALPATVRELVILRLATKQHFGYEWREHVRHGLNAGVSQSQIDELERAGETIESGDVFSEEERLALRFADAMQHGVLPEDLWREACDTWGRETSLDLVLAVAWWGGMVPMMLDGLGLGADGTIQRS